MSPSSIRGARVLPLLLVACGADPAPAPAPVPPPPTFAQVTPSAVVDAGMPRPPWAGEYPVTRIDDVVEHRFGIEIRDPYRWLEDAASPEVQQWTDAEAALAKRHLESLPDRAPLDARLRELFYTESRSVPVVAGKRLFFAARTPQQEKEVLYWRGHDGKDHVVLDPNTWPAKDNPTLHEWSPSHDGTKVAYSVSLHNGDEVTVHVIDVATGRESPHDVLPDLMEAAVSWGPGARGFYYRYLPPHDPRARVVDRFGLVEIRYHALGDDPAHDARLHDKTGDAALWLEPQVSTDGHWLFALTSRGDVEMQIEVRDLRPGAKSSAWTTLIGWGQGMSFIDAYHDHFQVLTNQGAPNWHVMKVDPSHPERARWTEIIPERKDARIEKASIVGGKLALRYVKDAAALLEIHALDGALVRALPLPEAGTASVPAGEPDGDDAYFSFESYTHPPEIEHLSIARGTTDTWYREKVPVDTSRFVTKQIFFTSKDGTRVPMFVVHAKDMKRDGSAPTLIQGYGGFDLSYEPQFKREYLPWLERGGIYAWVTLRGGGEYGEAWHGAGMLQKKQNVFDDFIGAAEDLIHEGYTRSDRLVAFGRSNGGLLMGSVMTQRPDLFRAILCGAPVLDMVRFHLVGAGRNWTAEYGDPDKEEDLRNVLAYSPIHNVKDGVRYPSLLMLSPANDDRVDPMHARKFVAELQAASTGGPVLLRIEHDAGHSGAGLRVSRADYWADAFAFALAEIRGVGDAMTGH